MFLKTQFTPTMGVAKMKMEKTDVKADKTAETAPTNDASKDMGKELENKPATEQAPADAQEAKAPRAVPAQAVEGEADVAKEKPHTLKNTGRMSHAQKISHDPAQPSSLTKPTQI